MLKFAEVINFAEEKKALHWLGWKGVYVRKKEFEYQIVQFS